MQGPASVLRIRALSACDLLVSNRRLAASTGQNFPEGAAAVMQAEPLLPFALSFAAGAMIFVVVEEVFPIEIEPVIDGRPASGSVACTAEDKQLQDHWTKCFYLRKNDVGLCFNFETPSMLSLKDRVRAQVVAVKAALDLIQPVGE